MYKDASSRTCRGGQRSQFTPRDATLDASWYQHRRSQLVTIKGFWKVLHKYLKPAADADTLRVPAPLIEFATKQVQTIHGMKGATLIALLTPELNYFQSSHTSLTEAANALKTQVPEAIWPRPMGFVELPYSQGPSFFTNVLLYHEIGHFVYEELHQKAAGADGGPLHSLCYRALRDTYGTEFTEKEIFCDVFAIRLIGPAFSFASVEMFSLLGLLDETRAVRFSSSHPAPACRYAQHLLELSGRDSWWDHVGEISGEHAKVIENLAAVSANRYELNLQTNLPLEGRRLIDAFLSVLNDVRVVAQDTTPNPTPGLEAFKAQWDDIQQCLILGVVPSRLLDQNGKLYPAHPVAVINASFCFYLQRLAELISKLKEQSPNNIDHRAFWTSRLEMWTMKALEDFALLEVNEPSV